MKELREYNIREVFLAIILIVLGSVTIVNFNGSLDIIVKILSVCVILDGIRYIYVLSKQSANITVLKLLLLQSVTEIFFGLLTIFNSTWIVSKLYLIIGVLVAIESMYKVHMSTIFKGNVIKWLFSILIACLIAIILLNVSLLIESKYVNIVIGFTIIIAQLPNLLISTKLVSKLKK